MSSDRHSGRAVLLAMGIALLATSAGCLRSGFVRSAGGQLDESAPEPAASAGERKTGRREAPSASGPGRVDSSVRSASVKAADVVPGGATSATPFLTAPGAYSPQPAGEFPVELRAVPEPGARDGMPASPPTSGAAPASAAPQSTPLLDAYIQRVADVTRQQREAIAASPAADDVVEGARKPAASSSAPTRSAAPATSNNTSNRERSDDPLESRAQEPDAVPLPERLSSRTQDDHPAPGVLADLGQRERADAPVVAASSIAKPAAVVVGSAGPSEAAAKPQATTSGAAAGGGATSKVLAAPEAGRAAAGGTATGGGVVADRETGENGGSAEGGATGAEKSGRASRLEITEVQLCRKIHGFGSVEAIAGARAKAGQQVLLYCEIKGIEYEERGDEFVSRISSRVEIKAASGGQVVWSRELGDAKDACRRRRRDYYVSCVVDLPSALGPGSYRLRLLQTDLVAGKTASHEIPLEIAP